MLADAPPAAPAGALPDASGAGLARGSVLSMLGTALAGLSTLAVTIVAARVVPPAEFGVMGVALLTTGVMQGVSQSGVDRAFVQRGAAESHVDVAWTLLFVRGVLLSLGALALAVPVARFFGEPRVAPVIAVLGVSFAIQGARSASTLLFTRALDFRALLVRDVLKSVASLGLALPLVLLLRSVWALVVAQLVAALVDVVVSYAGHPFRPKLSADRGKLRELLGYGRWIGAMGLLALAVTRLDDLVVGRVLGVAALGVYGMAFELGNLPATHVAYVLGRVTFPAYARLADGGDLGRVREAFLAVLRATALVVVPVGALLVAGTPGVVAHVLGTRWAGVLPLVPLLTAAGVARALLAAVGSLLQAVGRPDLDLRMNLPRLLVLGAGLYPASRLGGLPGAALVVLLGTLAVVPFAASGLSVTVGIGARAVFRALAPGLLAGGALGLSLTVALGVAVGQGEGALAWAARVLLGVGAWAASAWVVDRRLGRGPVTELRRLARVLRPRAPSAPVVGRA